MSDLSHIAPSSYFVVVKQSKKATGLDATKYLKKPFTALKQDSTETLTGWQALEITYPDKKLIYSEYNVLMGKDPYIVYSTAFKIGDDLYDIALKINSANAKNYYEFYNNIIYNFYHNDNIVFKIKDRIIKAKVIDLTKL